MFRDMGWRVITMKYGRRMEQAFARPGGDTLRMWVGLAERRASADQATVSSSSPRAGRPGSSASGAASARPG